MDFETLFWLIIVFVGVIWNLITKILQRMASPQPQPSDYEVEEYIDLEAQAMGDDSAEMKERPVSLYQQKSGGRTASSATYLMKGKKEAATPVKTVYTENARPFGKCSKRRKYSVVKLREAVIWSEILARPKAVRDSE